MIPKNDDLSKKERYLEFLVDKNDENDVLKIRRLKKEIEDEKKLLQEKSTKKTISGR